MAIQLAPFLAVVLALSQAVAGLNLTFTGNCSESTRKSRLADVRNIAYYNATGTTNFTARAVSGNDEPWYYYLTLQDGSQNGGRTSFIHRWLGVPGSFLDSDQGNSTSFCMYTSGGYDKSLKNKQGNDTCDGVLSKKCIRGFNDDIASRATDGCASLDPDVSDECELSASTGTYTLKEDANSSFYTNYVGKKKGSGSLSREKSCFLSSLPGVDVPEGYGVVSLLGVSYGDEKDQGTLKAYDKVVKESIATFFTFVENQEQSNGVVMSKVLASQPVCAIPNVVQGDSRPVGSAGEKLSQPAWISLALTMVFFVLSAVVV